MSLHGPTIAPVVDDFQYINPESEHPHTLIIDDHLIGFWKLCKVNMKLIKLKILNNLKLINI